MRQFIFDKYLSVLKKLSRGYGFGKIPVFRSFFKKTHQYLKPNLVTIQNQKMFLDPKDSLQLSVNGIYGEFETEIVKNEIKSDDVVIDVGAHIGYFTLLFAKLVGPKGKVFSFEPEPKNFELLKKNIEINNHFNVIAENKVVSDKNGKCILYTFETSSGANRLSKPDNNKKTKPIEVDSISLDEYFKNSEFTKKIKFIKIDVEGGEMDVLNSGRNLIDAQRPNFLIESLTKDELRNQIDFFKAYNYVALKIIRDDIFFVSSDEIFDNCREVDRNTIFIPA